jgi:hypothetical protein
MGVEDEHRAVTAHALLNSMTAVIGAIDIALQTDSLPDEVAEALTAARRQAHQVNQSLRHLVQGVPPDTLDLT